VFAEHLTDAQKRAYILADNRLALNAGWDVEMLSVELSDLQANAFDLSLLGFSDAEMNKLMGGMENAKDDDFDVDAELQKPTVSKLGDLWLLGNHRLVCGDSTQPETYTLLMDGKPAILSSRTRLTTSTTRVAQGRSKTTIWPQMRFINSFLRPLPRWKRSWRRMPVSMCSTLTPKG
jgi:hypothetical protein